MKRGNTLINLRAGLRRGFVMFACTVSLPGAQTVPVSENLARLVETQDTDGDRKITVLDEVTPFELRGKDGAVIGETDGFYPMSVLLQELKRAEDGRIDEVPIERLRLGENIVDRTRRLIREDYWDALTRRIDGAHVDEVVVDSKVRSKWDVIYVPGADVEAVRYFRKMEESAAERNRSPRLKVTVLPRPGEISGDHVRDLDGVHGILSLALEEDDAGNIRGVPYVVPGGRFNELYCWDSYFIVLGLLEDGRVDLARGMADNLLYQARLYGKVPNANRSYYLTRSQPPFLTSIVRGVYQKEGGDRKWLAQSLQTARKEYEEVWMGADRGVAIGKHRLNRYFDEGEGPCPEVEPGHYDEKIEPWMNQVGRSESGRPMTPHRFLGEYLYAGKHGDLEVDGLTLDAFFKHDRAVRESGHDTTHRFDDRTADFVSVDLNSLLYRYESDFAEILENEFGGRFSGLGDARWWRKRAAARKAAMMELMWDEERGYFFDYDVANGKRSSYISATGLYPLWAGMLDRETEKGMAKRVAAFACSKLEMKGGLAATAEESVRNARRKDGRQWDHPFGWAPHQMLAWRGLADYGLDADAERLAYRWLYTIARNAHDYNGTIPEKFDVVRCSHDVFVEYGNVGTKFSYIAPEGFGWMNGSFQVGLAFLSDGGLADLRALKEPAE